VAEKVKSGSTRRRFLEVRFFPMPPGYEKETASRRREWNGMDDRAG